MEDSKFYYIDVRLLYPYGKDNVLHPIHISIIHILSDKKEDSLSG